jgi:hypothetical protein
MPSMCRAHARGFEIGGRSARTEAESLQLQEVVGLIPRSSAGGKCVSERSDTNGSLILAQAPISVGSGNFDV